MNRPLKWFLLVLALAALPLGAVLAQSRAPTLLAWGSSQSSSSFYLQYTALAQTINKHVKDVQLTVVETGGSEENLRKLRTGELAAGLVGVEAAFDAYNGLGRYKGAQFRDLRILFVHNLAPQSWVVTADSGVKSLRDLDGKPFASGARGSTTDVLARSVLDALGIKPRYFVGSNDDIVNAMKDGRIVGYVKSSPSESKLDASTQEIHMTRKLVFLGFAADEQARVRQAVPVIASWVKVPREGWVSGQPELLTYATTVAVGTTTALNADLAYRMLDAITTNFDEVVATFPALKGADIQGLTLASALPLHPAAVRWLQAKGRTVPDSLIAK